MWIDWLPGLSRASTHPESLDLSSLDFNFFKTMFWLNLDFTLIPLRLDLDLDPHETQFWT